MKKLFILLLLFLFSHAQYAHADNCKLIEEQKPITFNILANKDRLEIHYDIVGVTLENNKPDKFATVVYSQYLYKNRDPYYVLGIRIHDKNIEQYGKLNNTLLAYTSNKKIIPHKQFSSPSEARGDQFVYIGNKKLQNYFVIPLKSGNPIRFIKLFFDKKEILVTVNIEKIYKINNTFSKKITTIRNNFKSGKC